jgi:predicted metal-dependent peptidase
MPKQKLSEARILARNKMPYLTHQILSLVPVERPGLGTMAVDKYLRVYYDPEFVNKTLLPELAYVITHEALHPLLMHHARAQGLIGVPPDAKRKDLFNLAADCAVAEALKTSGLTEPDYVVTPGKLDLPSDLCMEQYFDALLDREEQKQKEQQKQQQQEKGDGQGEGQEEDKAGQGPPEEEDVGGDDPDSAGGDDQVDGEGGGTEGDGEGGGEQETEGESGGDSGGSGSSEGDASGDSPSDSPGGEAGSAEGSGGLPPEAEYKGKPPDRSQGDGGSGCDGIPKPWECGAPDEESPGYQDYEQDMLRDAVAHAVEEAEKSGRGNVPGGLNRMAKGLLHPTVDPLRDIEARLRYCLNTTSGFGRHTYKKRSRRQPPGCGLMPAHVKPCPKATVILDTSGSMGDKDLGLCLGVAAKVLKSLPDPRGLRVLVGDAAVRKAASVFRPEQVELIGGGGTSMKTLILEAVKEKPLPNVILVVTDGETDWPDHPIGCHVVACLTREDCVRYPVPKWIQKVVLHPKE